MTDVSVRVDLARLRQALNHEMQESDRRDVLAGVGVAVLAAPRAEVGGFSLFGGPDPYWTVTLYGRGVPPERLDGTVMLVPVEREMR